MEILHTVAGLWQGTGGPAASVSGLCGALAARGHEVTLLCGAGPLAPEVAAIESGVKVRTASLGPYRLGHLSREFHRACRSHASAEGLVHTHGLWLFPNWSSASVARRLGSPLVISPRGMVEPWSMSRSRWRKKVLWALRERRAFSDAAFIHATSDEEAESVRALGVATPVAVVPNGVDLEGPFKTGIVDTHKRAPRDRSREGPRVLFLGRLHPKKGLDLLIAAWSRIAQEMPEACLTICGPGEPAHVERVEGWIAERTVPGVELRGRVEGEEKIRLLSRATVVVLPSLSENYGMVIAEALACRTPVITTTETPWSSIAETGCGWYVRPDVEDLFGALRSALRLESGERESMGRRGRALIERHHSLSASAARMEAAYSWALGKTPPPDWIRTDELS